MAHGARRWEDTTTSDAARGVRPARVTRCGVRRLVPPEPEPAERDIVVTDTEHEFWNRPDRDVAFAEVDALLVAMRREIFAWGTAGARVGAYIGYPTDLETARLVMLVDFVFANDAVRDPELAYRHIHRGVPLRDRFASFVKARVAVWPIFYANGEVDMRSAIATQGAAAVEGTFRAAHSADTALRDYPIAGFVYFTLESLP